MDVLVAFALVVLLFVALASGLWIGMALVAVGLIAMDLATSRPVGDSMVLTIWGAQSSWTRTARACAAAATAITSPNAATCIRGATATPWAPISSSRRRGSSRVER